MRRSPFSIFRDNAKFLMVILIALAMFAFIIMDQLSPENFPYVIGFLAGAGVFWLIGRRLGKPLPYAVAGAVLGLAGAMLVAGGTTPQNVAVRTTAGDISVRELEQLIRQRDLANTFLEEAWVAANSKLTREDDEYVKALGAETVRNLKAQQARATADGVKFTYSGTAQLTAQQLREDVVFGWLMRQEAEAMGIRISDAAINDFIRVRTRDRLTQEDMRAIMNRLGIRRGPLYDALRNELAAQRARELSQPTLVATPRQYWDDYKKLNVLASLEVAAVPVATFAANVPLPPEEQLVEFFEKHKDLVPNEAGPGEPGFLQPARVSLAYVQADVAEIEPTVADPTSEEIENHYYDHLELYRELPAFEGLRSGTERGGAAPAGDERLINPLFTPEQGSGQSGPPTPPPIPALPSPQDEAAPESPAAPDSTQPTTPAEPVSPAETVPSPEPEGGSAAFDPDDASLQFVVQQEPAEAPEAADSTAGAAPAESAPAADAPAAGPPVGGAPEQTPRFRSLDADLTDENLFPDDGPELPSPAPKGPPEPPPIPRYRPLDDKLRAEIREDLRRGRARAEAQRRINTARERMRALANDWRLAADPKNRPTRAELDARLKEIAGELGLTYIETPLLDAEQFSKAEEYTIARSSVTSASASNSFDFQVSAALGEAFNPDMPIYQPEEAIDRAHGLHFAYWKTAFAAPHVPLFAPIDVEPDTRLSELNEQLGGRAFPSLDEHFKLAEFVLRENRGVVPSAGWSFRWNQYLIVVEEVDGAGGTGGRISRIRIEEPGVREIVEQAWKVQKARPTALARAEELAKTARTAGGSLEEALANQTVTGDASGAPLRVEPAGSFSWFRLSSAPTTSMRQSERPVLSEIPAVPNAGEEFMRTVFESLSAGETGVAPDRDHDVYYVIRVVMKTPADPAKDERFLTRFLNEDLVLAPGERSLFGPDATPFELLAAGRRQAMIYDWAARIREKYDVQVLDPNWRQ